MNQYGFAESHSTLYLFNLCHNNVHSSTNVLHDAVSPPHLSKHYLTKIIPTQLSIMEMFLLLLKLNCGTNSPVLRDQPKFRSVQSPVGKVTVCTALKKPNANRHSIKRGLQIWIRIRVHGRFFTILINWYSPNLSFIFRYLTFAQGQGNTFVLFLFLDLPSLPLS